MDPRAHIHHQIIALAAVFDDGGAGCVAEYDDVQPVFRIEEDRLAGVAAVADAARREKPAGLRVLFVHIDEAQRARFAHTGRVVLKGHGQRFALQQRRAAAQQRTDVLFRIGDARKQPRVAGHAAQKAAVVVVHKADFRIGHIRIDGVAVAAGQEAAARQIERRGDALHEQLVQPPTVNPLEDFAQQYEAGAAVHYVRARGNVGGDREDVAGDVIVGVSSQIERLVADADGVGEQMAHGQSARIAEKRRDGRIECDRALLERHERQRRRDHDLCDRGHVKARVFVDFLAGGAVNVRQHRVEAPHAHGDIRNQPLVQQAVETLSQLHLKKLLIALMTVFYHGKAKNAIIA